MVAESNSLVVCALGMGGVKRGRRKRSGGTRELWRVTGMSVIFVIVMIGVYICQNVSNVTLYFNYTSIKLLEKDIRKQKEIG